MLKSSMFIFDNFLGKRPVPESAEVICSRRPHFEHLRLDNIRDGPYQLRFVQPLGRQLRRLDLHFVSRTTVFEDWFITFLESFAVLVELSIILNRRTDETSLSGPCNQVPVLSESILRRILCCFKDCMSLKAIHLSDEETRPLCASELNDLHPISPSVQLISWGCDTGKQAFKVVHDAETKKAHGVPFDDVSFELQEMVFDWTSENTFRHFFDP